MPKQERTKYVPPEESSRQYDYNEQEAVQDHEKARKAQIAHEAGKAAVEASDELLDEIDALLEENAADFVAQFIQKGGQ